MMHLNDTDFERVVLKGNGRYIVLFRADWCRFCKAFEPIFARYKNTVNGFEFAETDISDEDSKIWDELNIKAIPTLVAFDRRVPVSRLDPGLGVGLNEKMFKVFLDRLREKQDTK